MENERVKIGLVIMASGLGKRFGGNKLMAELKGKPMVKWILDKTDSMFDSRIVVTRSYEVKSLCEENDIECIFHELPNRNDTVRLGLSAMRSRVDYCFFMPGDQPLISRDTLCRLRDEAQIHNDEIIRTGYMDNVGSPVGFPEKYFDELINLPEGKGGNFVVNRHPEVLRKVMVKDEFELFDVDTVEDLEKIKILCYCL